MINVNNINAYSVAGEATCIQINHLNVAFDMGPSAHAVNISNVFFTHPHIDHLGSIVSHCAMRNLRGSSAPNYYIHKDLVEKVNNLFACWNKLDGSNLRYNLIPVDDTSVIKIKDFFIRPFNTTHRIPTLGYVIYKLAKKLLPEFKDLDPKQLGQLRKDKKVIETEEEIPLFAFCGDTTINVFDNHPFLLDVKTLVLECTFVDSGVLPSKAKIGGHVHLDDIVEYAKLFKNDNLLLTHFSRRYSRNHIEQMLLEKIPNELKKIVYWLNHSGKIIKLG